MVHGESTQGSNGSARTGAEVLIDADGSDNDVLQEDADEQDQILETIDGDGRGYSAASGQRSFLRAIGEELPLPHGIPTIESSPDLRRIQRPPVISSQGVSLVKVRLTSKSQSEQ